MAAYEYADFQAYKYFESDTNVNPLDLLHSRKLVKVCAPMVRYSKLPFRLLVRKYGVDLAFTPMIDCESFLKSQEGRNNEFTTNADDHPLIVQFGVKSAEELADAAELVYNYCDGVDVNCGCPQRWAISKGYGVALMKNPQLARDMVYQTRNRIPDRDFTVSMKIRMHDEIRKTVSMCRQAEHAGISFISVHGRTPTERCEPVHLNELRTIKDSLSIPVIGNGDIFTMDDALKMEKQTFVNGVMCARGILENPALFTGAESTPLNCLRDWIEISLETGSSFQVFHNHVSFMVEKSFLPEERSALALLSSTSAVLDYLESIFGDDWLKPETEEFQPLLMVRSSSPAELPATSKDFTQEFQPNDPLLMNKSSSLDELPSNR